MPITSDLTPRPDFNADENLAHLTEALAPQMKGFKTPVLSVLDSGFRLLRDVMASLA